MAPKQVNLYEAKTHLSEIVERASRGETIIIAKGNRPVARLGPLPTRRKKRVPGGGKGRVWVSDTFDAPLPDDILRAFGDDQS